MINQIPKIFTSTGKRFISNVKFPKTNHLPRSNSDTRVSWACFDPAELRANAAKREKIEPKPHLNIKEINNTLPQTPLHNKYTETTETTETTENTEKAPNLIENQIKKEIRNAKFPKNSQLAPNPNYCPSSSTVMDIKTGAVKTPQFLSKSIQPPLTTTTLPKISHRPPNTNGCASSSDVMKIQGHEISNIKFPKISHLPISGRDTQASGFCFDPEKS